jgi:hypothetical protein
MWILLEKGIGTLSGTVVGFVLFGCNDPVPSKLIKVNGEGVATASGLFETLITVEAGVTGCSGPTPLAQLYFKERVLNGDQKVECQIRKIMPGYFQEYKFGSLHHFQTMLASSD